MENEFIIKEINFLKATFNIHIFTCVFILFIHIAVYENIYWLFEHSIIMFEISLYIFISLCFLLIIIYFAFLCTKVIEKTIKIFIKITLTFFFISIINSLYCSIISCYNSTLFNSFYLDCPFNYKIDEISNMINKVSNLEKAKKNMCNSRKCFNINNISNIYLCNFKEKNKYYVLYPNEEFNITYPEIYNFSKYCRNYTNFYYIFKDKYQTYDIDYDFQCPSKSSMTYNYVMTYLFIFCNIFCSPILYLFEYCSLNTLLKLINSARNYNMSLRETNNTSKIDGNNNLSVNNGEQTFKKQKTEIIIIDNSSLEQKQKIQENKEVNNNNCKDTSKSENQLITNMNNNIFKIINQNENLKKDDKK